MSAQFASSIMEIANLPVKIREPGYQRRRTVSLFEMMVLRLATGQTSRRRSVVPFIRLVINAARINEIPALLTPSQAPAPMLDQQLRLVKATLDLAMAHGTNDEIDRALDMYLAVLRRSAVGKAGA